MFFFPGWSHSHPKLLCFYYNISTNDSCIFISSLDSYIQLLLFIFTLTVPTESKLISCKNESLSFPNCWSICISCCVCMYVCVCACVCFKALPIRHSIQISGYSGLYHFPYTHQVSYTVLPLDMAFLLCNFSPQPQFSLPHMTSWPALVQWFSKCVIS